ncbi:hypothetical protein ABH988_007430 [Bradyrhizobium ottawaense]
MPNSVIISTRRSQPTSLQPASEYVSPSVSIGSRVLVRIIAISVSLTTPWSISFSMGM